MGEREIEVLGPERGTALIGRFAAELPAPIATAGPNAVRRYAEFFAAQIRNPNTRAAYAAAASRFFRWCEEHELELAAIEPLHVAAYVELLGRQLAPASVKQHLAALRSLFDWLVVGHVIRSNPSTSVRGPRIRVTTGKTPFLDDDEARKLFSSIETDTLVGLRDRALLAVMTYSFARVSAAVGMRVRDFATRGTGSVFRLNEKRGRYSEVPAHHKAAEYVHAYIEAAGIAGDRDGPLFRSAGRGRRAALGDRLLKKPLDRRSALAMVKRRARAAGLSDELQNHTFRATGVTSYLNGGGSLEVAQGIAGHADPRTTKLYDRTGSKLDQGEIERIRI